MEHLYVRTYICTYIHSEERRCRKEYVMLPDSNLMRAQQVSTFSIVSEVEDQGFQTRGRPSELVKCKRANKDDAHTWLALQERRRYVHAQRQALTGQVHTYCTSSIF